MALVLAGGAARGAYEVGVVKHIAEDVSKSHSMRREDLRNADSSPH